MFEYEKTFISTKCGFGMDWGIKLTGKGKIARL